MLAHTIVGMSLLTFGYQYAGHQGLTSRASPMVHVDWGGLEQPAEPVMAFSRNLSGHWDHGDGLKLVAVHQAGSPRASFTFGWEDPSTGLQTVTIHAEIEDRLTPTPDQFIARGNGSASFTLIHPEYGRCRVTGAAMSFWGTVVGQVGGRKLHVDDYGALMLRTDCGPDGPVMVPLDLSGIWG